MEYDKSYRGDLKKWLRVYSQNMADLRVVWEAQRDLLVKGV